MKEVKVFRDPLYGYVKVEEQLIWELIQTKEFQRLRRIHQLGGTYIIYHTAEHSRFSHSLGVYEVTRRIIYEVDDIRTTLTKEERLITLCAALLHDIGHGPFSHAFEMVFDTVHELYSIQIILDDSTEIHHKLEAYEKGFSKKVASVIEKRCYKQRCTNSCNHHIMVDLISSQLDADRLDYLQRDAYNSGATYGEIDLERIIRSFLVVNKRIAFKYTSMHAIEDYLMSRYHMYWQVYFHPVGVSYELLLINIFKRVRELISKGFKFVSNVILIDKIIQKTLNIDEYLELDEAWMIYKIKEWRYELDDILVDLCNRFLNRRLYKHITCQTKEALESKYNQIVELYNQYQINNSYYLYKDTLIKEAYQYYNEEALHNSPILLKVEEELVEIAELSHIVKGIKGIGAKTDYKLYYTEELFNQFSPEDQLKAMEIIKK